MSKPKQVDSKVPRGKAAFHTLIPALAFLLNPISAPILGQTVVGLTGAVMTVSVVAGPRWSLFGRLFTGVIRPLFNVKTGKIEEAAPHRFAEAVGAVFLLAAGGAFYFGQDLIGWGLALAVSALAALNWLGGICVGCQMYLLIGRLTGRRMQGQTSE